MEQNRLSIEELEEIAKVYLTEMAKSERGREFLRRFLAGHYLNGVSMIDQLPQDMADEFTKGLNDVYEVLIKGKSKESGGS